MFTFRKLSVLLFLFFISAKGISQEAAAADSVKLALSKAVTVQEKIELLDELSRIMMNVNPSEADEYGKSLIKMAEESRDRKLMFKAYLSNGIRCAYFVTQKTYSL